MNLTATLKKNGLIWLILIVPFVFIILYWNQFPAQIPTHFNLKGEADGFSGKTFGLLLLPCINVLIYLLFIALPKIDPSGKNFSLYPHKYKIIQLVLQLFILILFFITAFYALHKLNTSNLIDYVVILFLLVFGNYLGSIRHNYFIGIRTPWTLANEDVWTVTHRFAGKLWVAASIILLLISFFIALSEALFITYIAIIVVVPTIYSYILFKRIPKK
ncbi:MAG TPA: SdpI family protein [Bacteroidia bacterium]|nr:SdpI family protein [Bacteroidia bacterium]